MPSKKQFCDFLCAFVIFTILLATISIISAQGFFENAFYWDSKSHNLSLLGYKISVTPKIPYVLNNLLSFNDILFGGGFANGIRKILSGSLNFAGQIIMLMMEMLKTVTGAK